MEKGTVVRHTFSLIALSALVGAVLMLWPVENRTEAAQGSSALPAQAVNLYLPIVMKSLVPSIHGLVTLNGAPAAGVTITLLFSNTVAFSPIMTQTTSSDGTYHFVNAPSLAPGQRYLVQYVRPSGTTNTLRSWSTKPLTSYSQNEDRVAGNFDIADVTLLQPSADVTISLPFTFQWNVRPASPTDSYKLQMNDPVTGDQWWTSANLGHSGGYALNALPPGISAGVLTTWSVIVLAPDSGNGRSSTRKVTFQ